PLPEVLRREIRGDVLGIEERLGLLGHAERDLGTAAIPALDRSIELRERAVHERLMARQDLSKIAVTREQIVQEVDRLARPPVREPALGLLFHAVEREPRSERRVA